MKHLIQLIELEQGLESSTEVKLEVAGTHGPVKLKLANDQLIRVQSVIAHEIEAVMAPVNESLFTKQWLADLQEYLMEFQHTVEDWSVTFEHEDVTIMNPFKDPSARFDVTPESMYGASYTNSDWTYKSPLVILNFRNTMLDFIKYAVGDDTHLDSVDFMQVLAQFIFEVARDIVPNDFVAQDAREVLTFLINYDAYYTAMELLVELHSSTNRRINYDNIIEKGLNAFKSGAYDIV